MAHRKGRPRQKRAGKAWTKGEKQDLIRLRNKNTPTRLIADALGRTEDAVRSKASDEGISLRPTNRSPYGSRRKRR